MVKKYQVPNSADHAWPRIDEKVFFKAQKEGRHLDNIKMVGGSTYIPKLKKMVVGMMLHPATSYNTHYHLKFLKKNIRKNTNQDQILFYFYFFQIFLPNLKCY